MEAIKLHLSGPPGVHPDSFDLGAASTADVRVDFGRAHLKRGWLRRTFTASSASAALPIEWVGKTSDKFFAFPTSKEVDDGIFVDVYLRAQEVGEYCETHQLRVHPPGGEVRTVTIECFGDIVAEDDGRPSTIISRDVRDVKITEEDAFQRYWAAVAQGLRGGRNENFIWRVAVKRIERMLGKKAADLRPEDREEICSVVAAKVFDAVKAQRPEADPGRFTEYCLTTVSRELSNHWRQRSRNPTVRLETEMSTSEGDRSTRTDTSTPATRIGPSEAFVGPLLLDSYREAVQGAFLARTPAERRAWQDPARRVSPANADKQNRSRAVKYMSDALAPTYIELLTGWTDQAEFPDYESLERNLKTVRANLNQQLKDARWIEQNGESIPVVLADWA